MAFDGDANLRIVAKEVSRLAERVARVGTNVGLIEIEIGVANLASEQFVKRGFAGGSGRRGHRDSGAGVGRATGTTGRNRVGCRSGRRNFRGALRVDGADIGSDGKLRRVRGSPV